MNRYNQLIDIIKDIKPREIVEVGTWNGIRAMLMAEEALKHQDQVHYTGFDLFEHATDETDKRELNVKEHVSAERVAEKLAAFAENHKGFSYDLIVGDTNETLRDFKRNPDFAFIDGGHSVATLRSDIDHLRGAKLVVVDDFYTPDKEGKCPDLTKYGCNSVLEGLNYTLLPIQDPVKGGGLVQMAMFGNVKKKLQVHTKNCVVDNQIKANVRYCGTLIDRWIAECNPHNLTAVLCSGGPSLKGQFDVLKKLYKKRDHMVFCVKHAHDLLIEQGIVPDGCILLDPRPHSKDFIEHPHPDVNYFTATMCHPVTVDKLRDAGAKVFGYNALVGAGEDQVFKEMALELSGPDKKVHMLPGGCGAATRGVTVLYCLGFRKFKLFGYDACYPENVGKKTQGATDKECLRVEVHGREFWTDAELIAQCNDFERLFQSQNVDIEVFGDGMIPHIYHSLRKVRPEFKDLINGKNGGSVSGATSRTG